MRALYKLAFAQFRRSGKPATRADDRMDWGDVNADHLWRYCFEDKTLLSPYNRAFETLAEMCERRFYGKEAVLELVIAACREVGAEKEEQRVAKAEAEKQRIANAEEARRREAEEEERRKKAKEEAEATKKKAKAKSAPKAKAGPKDELLAPHEIWKKETLFSKQDEVTRAEYKMKAAQQKLAREKQKVA